MLVAALTLLLAGAEPALGPTTPLAPVDCWTEPLQLELHDFVLAGRVLNEGLRHRCRVGRSAESVHFYMGPTRIGTHRLASFTLFGKPLGLDLNAMVGPGQNAFDKLALGQTGPDFYYVAPGLDLPDEWDHAIEQASTPVLLVGSAAIFTTVIFQLVKSKR